MLSPIKALNPKNAQDRVKIPIGEAIVGWGLPHQQKTRIEKVSQMSEPNSQTEKPKDGRRYDPELLKKGLHCDLDQYEMLKRCSDKKDVTEWNEWRKKNPDEDILLEGQDFTGWYLRGAYLHKGGLVDTNPLSVKIFKGNVFLTDTNFFGTHLEHVKLLNAHLEKSKFVKAHLQNADFQGAHLKDSHFNQAHLEGADFNGADLQGADFSLAIVDGGTLIWTYEVDQKTKFEGVGLDAGRIYPRTKQLLERNIRQMNWEEWYEWKDWFKYAPMEPRHKLHQLFLRATIGCFWWISDYGISTKRIILVFLGLALFFAVIYSNWACWFPPGMVSNLEIEPYSPLWQYGIVVFLRPIYFSVVTMTTLGFGDMYAHDQSIWGHILLTFQMILGYVLLGALITRFAVLFTAGGPAGRFVDEKEEKENDEK